MRTTGWIVKRMRENTWMYLADFGGTVDGTWSENPGHAYVFGRKHHASVAARCFNATVTKNMTRMAPWRPIRPTCSNTIVRGA